MTSSSSTSGSGSMSSQSVPSSMDSAATVATQDVIDGNWSEQDEVDDSIWGKLYPVGKGFSLLDLRKDYYSFGRDTKSDVCFTATAFTKNIHFQAFSKKHFEIIKESSEGAQTNTHVVYIKDWSSNGTFLKGEMIGKGNKQVIQNNDEIALARPENRAYMFIDHEATNEEQEILPKDVKEKYTLSTRVLGRGVCGEVRLAFSKGSDCQKYAIKIISKRNFSSLENVLKEDVSTEVDILRKLDHPCIVKVIDVFDSPENLYIVLELVEGGELFDHVSRLGKLKESATKLFFYQILVAVKYLHDNGFTHRDLKPENVLLCSANSDYSLVKVTDFGVSKFVGEQSLMKTLCGTPCYLAPEVLRSEGTEGYKKKCDCWSLGVILYVCLGGTPPFFEQRHKSLKNQVLEGSYSFPDHIWKSVNSEAKDLIRKLLTVDPEERLSVAKALEHPWMQDEKIIEKAKILMEQGDQKKEEHMPPPVQNVPKRMEEAEGASPPLKRQKSTPTES